MKVRILSIEGGGILGLSSILILKEIEKRLSYRLQRQALITNYFDLFAGNSAGSVIIALLLTKNKNNEYRTIDEVQNVFISYKQTKTTLEDIFQHTRLRELEKPCLLPAYEPDKNWLNFFTQQNAVLEDCHDFYVKDAVGASCALPVFKTPAAIQSFSSGKITTNSFQSIFKDDKESAKDLITFLEMNKIIDTQGNMINALTQEELYQGLAWPAKYHKYRYQISRIIDRIINNKFRFIDGCVFANNPSLCAVIEASKLNFTERGHEKPSIHNMMLVSMGFRNRKNTNYIEDVMNPKFRGQLLEILFKTSQELTHYQLHYLFDTNNCSDAYFPVYPENTRGGYNPSQILNTSEENIAALTKASEEYINKHDIYLNQIVDNLTAEK